MHSNTFVPFITISVPSFINRSTYVIKLLLGRYQHRKRSYKYINQEQPRIVMGLLDGNNNTVDSVTELECSSKRSEITSIEFILLRGGVLYSVRGNVHTWNEPHNAEGTDKSKCRARFECPRYLLV